MEELATVACFQALSLQFLNCSLYSSFHLIAKESLQPLVVLQAKGLWQRVTGSHQPEAMSWDSVKGWASSQGKVLPAPTKTQLVHSKATNTPIEQIQVSASQAFCSVLVKHMPGARLCLPVKYLFEFD